MSQLANIDTPMLRNLYRQLRGNTITLSGGSTKQFDAAVEAEIEFRGDEASPYNYVLCAMQIEREETFRNAWADGAESVFDNSRDQWEAKMEDKYDFNKEN